MIIVKITLSKNDILVQTEARCPSCGMPFDPAQHVVVCPGDGTPHHVECWIENGNHCTTLYCQGAGEVEELPENYYVFISHASEDKAEVARPLANELKRYGLEVWIDEYELTVGDNLRREIDRGLREARFGAVILSHNFFNKEWPQRELDALVARDDGKEKIILPIWHKITQKDVVKYSPLLAAKLAVSTDKGISFVAEEIIRAIQREKKK